MTGATGFVGQALCRQLTAEGAKLRVLLRSPNRATALPQDLGIEQAIGDLSDAQSLMAACAGIDCVIHLAGTAHVASASPSSGAQSNETGSQNLVSAAIAQRVKRFVFLSSSLAHAAETGVGDVTEYGKAKLATEKLLLERAGELDSVVLRAVNVYGVGMKGNIARMIELISRNRLPRLPALSTRISLVGVDDVATALILAVESDRGIGRTYTVTDSEVYAINDIEAAIYRFLAKPMSQWRTPAVLLYAASAAAGMLSSILGGRGSISLRTYRNLTTDNVFANDEIREELGFEPSTSFYEELPGIAAEFKREHSKEA